MLRVFTFLLLLSASNAHGQELYVFSEPASNIPAHSLSVKLKDHFVTDDNIYSRFSNRLMPQVMFGMSKKLMVRGSFSVANMHTADTHTD